MAYNAEFHDGFDALGPVGQVLISNDVIADNCQLFAQEWTGIWKNQGTAAPVSAEVVDSLGELGRALKISVGSSTTGQAGITRTLPGSYGRIVGGMTLNVPSFSAGYLVGAVFGDGDSDQICVVVNASGQIEVRRASSTNSALDGTLLGTSTQSISAGENAVLSWDITPHNSAGKVKVWLNHDEVLLNITGADTQNTANAQISTVRIMLSVFFLGGFTNSVIVDDYYCWMFTSSGGSETPAANPIVETQFPIDDDSIDFAFGAAILGPDYSATTSTSAPGANQLALRKYTPDASGTLEDVTIVPGATSAGAKFKAVAYSDSGGAPNSLLSSGTEAIGCVDGTPLTLALTSSQAITKGTPVWIGFITDTSVALMETDDTTTLGYKASNTYASGAPGTAPTMTPNQASWVIFGGVTGQSADFWSIVDNNPHSGDLSYMVSSSAGDQDLFIFPELSSTPTTIYSLGVKVVMRRADSGARTIDLRTKSAAVTDSGDNAGQTPSTNYGTLSSYWSTDPDTSAAWNASAVNLATHGYKIAS